MSQSSKWGFVGWVIVFSIILGACAAAPFEIVPATTLSPEASLKAEVSDACIDIYLIGDESPGQIRQARREYERRASASGSPSLFAATWETNCFFGVPPAPTTTTTTTTTTTLPPEWTSTEYADVLDYCVTVGLTAVACPAIVNNIRDKLLCSPVAAYAVLAKGVSTVSDGADTAARGNAIEAVAAAQGCLKPTG